jgi:hypothetical protein
MFVVTVISYSDAVAMSVDRNAVKMTLTARVASLSAKEIYRLFVEVIVRLAELSQFEEYLAKHEILKFAS